MNSRTTNGTDSNPCCHRNAQPPGDLPERYGNWKTVYSRFRRWQTAGIWDRILTEIQVAAAHDDQIDGSITMIDSTSIRAQQHAAGARKRGIPTRTTASAGVGAALGANCT